MTTAGVVEDSSIHDKFISWRDNCNEGDWEKRIVTGETLIKTINSARIFDPEEHIEDLTLKCLELLQIAYFMGNIFLEKPYDTKTRKNDLENSRNYYLNFLDIITQYGILDEKFQQKIDAYKSKLSDPSKVLYINRDSIIQNQITKRNLQEDIKEFDELNGQTSEGQRRDYFMRCLKYYALEAFTNLYSISRELQMINLVREEPQKLQKPPEMSSVASLRIEKINKVFGAGYPSTPTMSLDDWLKNEVNSGRINLNPQKEKEDVQTDDVDDDQNLTSERDFDDFKDWNRRGAGNTFNRG